MAFVRSNYFLRNNIELGRKVHIIGIGELDYCKFDMKNKHQDNELTGEEEISLAEDMDELDSDLVTRKATKNFESDVLDSIGETFAGEPIDSILDELDLVDSGSLDFTSPY